MRHGSEINPPNRFDRVHHLAEDEQLEWDTEYRTAREQKPIQYLDDDAKSIVVQNDSPDIPFRYSVNPYRGCAHGCAYCYARNSHEYLGLNAGLDFETKIFVKHAAPQLFRDFLSRKNLRPEPIIFSGITDCYQPAERQFQLTRGCLKIAHECNQPISIITKNALVVRDLDLLQPMAAKRLVHVNLSITTLNPELARDLEPRTSIPAARLRAVSALAAAGVPVRVMAAPIIPGLNDHELPQIMQAAKEAGALDVRYILLRLPITVAPVFQEWLSRTQTLQASKVESLVRQTRDGKLNDSSWGQRMVGSGTIAEQIRMLVKVFRQKLNFGELPEHDRTLFVPPIKAKENHRETKFSDGQLPLF